jgi:hypothetical protein
MARKAGSNTKGARVISADSIRDVNKAIDRFLKDPAIVRFLEGDLQSFGSNSLSLVRMFNKKYDHHINAMIRKFLKEKSK